MAIREPVRECLEKDPADRTPEDIDILLEFTQTFPAFFNMTLATRRALCAGKETLVGVIAKFECISITLQISTDLDLELNQLINKDWSLVFQLWFLLWWKKPAQS